MFNLEKYDNGSSRYEDTDEYTMSEKGPSRRKTTAILVNEPVKLRPAASTSKNNQRANGFARFKTTRASNNVFLPSLAK